MGSKDYIKAFVELGCYISLSPACVKSDKQYEMIRRIPLDRLMLESDSPYLINTDLILKYDPNH